MEIRPNRPTLDTIREMPVGEVMAMPAEHLALLQMDARTALEGAKRLQDWIEGAIALRFERRAAEARAVFHKDTGTARFLDGSVEIAADLPKKVEWDQERLAALVIQIRDGGEDPSEYVETSYRVSERAYAAWPERIRQAFAPARTVRTGKATFRLSILSDTALRDSPHGPGILPPRGGR
jgi:hypothetical protein